jgi:hypothetical protein
MKLFVALSRFPKSILPWLFLLAYLIHISEEYLGGGALQTGFNANLKGVNLTASQFLIVNGIVFLLFLLLIFLAQKFKFPDWLSVCLGTIILINAISHTVSTVTMAEYSPGLITGLLIFMPLGGLSLFGLRARMSARRYLIAIAAGIATHGVVTLITLRGNDLFRL